MLQTDWRSLHGNAFDGKHCLVTGGAGFIGSHIVEALTKLGAKVVVIDNLVGGATANIEPFKPQFIQGSIVDRPTIERAAAGAQYIFHLAALGSVPGSLERPV